MDELIFSHLFIHRVKILIVILLYKNNHYIFTKKYIIMLE